PDCGSVSQMLQHATGRLPKFIGKPEPEIAELAISKHTITKEDTVLIGDRIYTDIACAVNAGITSVFVLSGEGTLEDLKTSEVKPDIVIKNIKKIYEVLKNE
ncbi:MAG: HAD hydrolase-like protein, partial [Eggerthellaceae bacterium]|nr:HAD hydrolase-like protein [Eggerthellaceae bacterium]